MWEYIITTNGASSVWLGCLNCGLGFLHKPEHTTWCMMQLLGSLKKSQIYLDPQAHHVVCYSCRQKCRNCTKYLNMNAPHAMACAYWGIVEAKWNMQIPRHYMVCAVVSVNCVECIRVFEPNGAACHLVRLLEGPKGATWHVHTHCHHMPDSAISWIAL